MLGRYLAAFIAAGAMAHPKYKDRRRSRDYRDRAVYLAVLNLFDFAYTEPTKA